MKKKNKKKKQPIVKNGFGDCKFCGKRNMRNDSLKRHIKIKHCDENWLKDKGIQARIINEEKSDEIIDIENSFNYERQKWREQKEKYEKIIKEKNDALKKIDVELKES